MHIRYSHQPVRAIARSTRVLAATLLLSCTLASSQDAQPEALFKQGASAMQRGDLVGAEALFRRAAIISPGLPDAFLDLALVLGREGKLEEAILNLKSALKLNPRMRSANMFLGVFDYQLNLPAEAINALKQELNINPDDAETLMWLGIVELVKGDPENAAGYLDKAAALRPKDANILEARGRAHNLVARDSFAEMARLDPGSWHVHRVQAELDAENSRHSESIAEYITAIHLQPDVSDLYEELGDEYRKTNQLSLAKESYIKELRLSPRNPIAIYDLGSTEIELGEYEQGVAQLKTLPVSYAKVPVVTYYLGCGLAAVGEDAEAILNLTRSASSDNPEVQSRSYYQLTRLYRKTNRPAEAGNALAEYTRLKKAENTRNAQQIRDWQKLNGPVL